MRMVMMEDIRSREAVVVSVRYGQGGECDDGDDENEINRIRE
jgi:hypothetical protein